MASSVSSEQAFSSAGITISKRRNHLKKDIVEALQCLKCMYHNDLICAVETVSVADEEKAMEMDLDIIMDNEAANNLKEGFSWDQLVVDED